MSIWAFTYISYRVWDILKILSELNSACFFGLECAVRFVREGRISGMAELAEKAGFTIYHHVVLPLLNIRPYDSCTTDPPPLVVLVFSFQDYCTEHSPQLQSKPWLARLSTIVIFESISASAMLLEVVLRIWSCLIWSTSLYISLPSLPLLKLSAALLPLIAGP